MLRKILKFIGIIIGLIILWLFVTKVLFVAAVVNGNSMEPLYPENRFVLANRFTDSFQVGDVILFDDPRERLGAQPSVRIARIKEIVFYSEDIVSSQGAVVQKKGENFIIEYDNSITERIHHMPVAKQEVIGKVIGNGKR